MNPNGHCVAQTTPPLLTTDHLPRSATQFNSSSLEFQVSPRGWCAYMWHLFLFLGSPNHSKSTRYSCWAGPVTENLFVRFLVFFTLDLNLDLGLLIHSLLHSIPVHPFSSLSSLVSSCLSSSIPPYTLFQPLSVSGQFQSLPSSTFFICASGPAFRQLRSFALPNIRSTVTVYLLQPQLPNPTFFASHPNNRLLFPFLSPSSEASISFTIHHA